MKKYGRWLLLLLIVMTLSACSQTDSNSKNETQQTLTVSAAASLTDVTKSLEKAFKAQHPNVDVKFNYGGSGALRQQIEQGAPVDVFMSANTKDIDQLKKSNKVIDTYDYAQNKLVLIKQKDSEITHIQKLQKGDKIALGEIDSVPAGKYAKTYLESQGIWQTVEPNIVYAKDVREVLNYVNKGNAQLGFVYNTDLYVGKQKHKGVVKLADAPLDSPIVYRMGIVEDKQVAQDWQTFMKSDKAQKILKQYHFE
ncbi:molybdate ABC transporter substrate-binding protein [Staphylococcus sp. 17KM0847]|uniref:molybdate ABC transporter substrate-binding protein n=1 Tax=Staphylococcus sp. 17KM0847 TaxID=2583989 RepID=UPI0015DD1F0E|nr:molybdate ABC transporter substrate-binding protein [Staphylococcus sp. 17KM0847]QLK86645.1 molybdate ABC transporter substrate-binding protein [Staphylococcus sp. 17KM0847]